jgi:hypothetical protein
MEQSRKYNVQGVWTIKQFHHTQCLIAAQSHSFERVNYWGYDFTYTDKVEEDRIRFLRFATVVVIWCNLMDADSICVAKNSVIVVLISYH